MESVSNIMSIVFLSITLCFILQSHQVYGDLITGTCEHALYKDLCVTSLKSDPLSESADLKGLASIALSLATKHTTNMAYHIAELLNDTTDPFIQQSLTDCSESYMDAIDQLEDSAAALDTGAYNDVNMWVSAAMTDAHSCDDLFTQQPDSGSSVTVGNKGFKELCSNALAITNLLAKA
ncbi:hypothetical protein GIB67_031535 [Kingdonia uniflora]|uniref:Pectinesterase inhibitor domain-containing protein n=1 Tax=Kingdonia uniflora TaxID=39325 RepID=A0A7J7PC62_9MAGN|nr:hypothetical protein GIB67_031535 [Kingdonia uniflora]